MTVNEVLSRPSEKDDKTSYRQPVSEVSYNCNKKVISFRHFYIPDVTERKQRRQKMSGMDAKKPETREELVKILTEAAEKAKEPKAYLKPKPTISGTAKMLNIHRDTLYTWLKELNVDFKEVLDKIPTTYSDETVKDAGDVYLIG